MSSFSLTIENTEIEKKYKVHIFHWMVISLALKTKDFGYVDGGLMAFCTYVHTLYSCSLWWVPGWLPCSVLSSSKFTMFILGKE